MDKLRRNIMSVFNDMFKFGKTVTDDEFADAIMALLKPADLVWEFDPVRDYEMNKAITPIGTYFICNDRDDFTGIYVELVSCKNAEWYGSVTAHRVEVASCLDTPNEAKAAAQAHYNQMRSDVMGWK